MSAAQLPADTYPAGRRAAARQAALIAHLFRSPRMDGGGLCPYLTWRGMGGRAVEGTGLENRQAGDRLVGSNPTPSAIFLHPCKGQGTEIEDSP